MWPFSKKKDVRENLQQNARAIANGPDRTVRPVRDRTRAEIAREEWQERELDREIAENDREWAEWEESERIAEARQIENTKYLYKCYEIGVDPIFGKDKPGWNESMKDFYHRMLAEKERRDYDEWLRKA